MSADVAMDSTTATPASPSALRKRLKIAGWVVTAFFFLTVFTLLKLPEDKIKAYVLSSASQFLGPRGITMNAGESSVSVGFGVSYVMNDVVLNLPPPAESVVKIKKLAVSPSLIGMLFRKYGGDFWVYGDDGKILTGSAAIKGNIASIHFNANDLDLGKLGLMRILASVGGGAVVTGEGSISGDMYAMNTLTGAIKLDLKKIVLDQQSIAGFNVPRLSIATGSVDVVLDKGKALLKTVRLGKLESPADDIRGTISGEIGLARNLDASTINAKIRLGVSETVQKIPGFALVEGLLGTSKQPDGTFSFSLTGPIQNPIPTPVNP